MGLSVSDVVGGLGFGLGLFNAWWQFFANPRRALKIAAVPAIGGPDEGIAGEWCRITLANPGQHAVNARVAFFSCERRPRSRGAALTLVWRHGRRWRNFLRRTHHVPEGSYYRPDFPGAILPGKSVIIWVPMDAYKEIASAEGVTRCRLVVQDELDRSIRSRPLWRPKPYLAAAPPDTAR